MFRIDSDGATVDNRFTEGNPSASIPATVVSAEILNSFQEEIIKPITEMGIALDKGNEGQLYQALLLLALNGGRKLSYKSEILNNSTSIDLEDTNDSNSLLTVNRTLTKIKIFFFDIERKSDDGTLKEFGIMFLSYDSSSNSFLTPKYFSLNGDAEVEFSLVQVGSTDEFKLQYTSGDLTGANYEGRIDLTSIVEIKQ